jgi:hypothetical protein
MQIEWLGQPASCPPGTVRSGDFCLPFGTPAVLPAAPPPPVTEIPTVTITPAPTAEEKKNRTLIIAGGVVALGLLAYAVLR